jgi:hypothetical protein
MAEKRQEKKKNKINFFNLLARLEPKNKILLGKILTTSIVRTSFKALKKSKNRKL